MVGSYAGLPFYRHFTPFFSGQLWTEHKWLPVLHHDREMRLPRREARRLWEGHRWDAHTAQDRERPYRAEQPPQARGEDSWLVVPFSSPSSC